MSAFLLGALYGGGTVSVGGGPLVSTTPGTYEGQPLAWDNGQSKWTAHNFIAVGASASTTGNIRLPNNAYVKALNQAGNADKAMIGLSTADLVEVGDSSVQALISGTTVRATGSTAVYLRVGSTDHVGAGNTAGFTDLLQNVSMSKACIGHEAVSSPYSVHGAVTITMTDADITLTAAQFKYQMWHIDQTATTATRTVFCPNPPSKAEAYCKDIIHFGDIARNIVFSCGAGTETVTMTSTVGAFASGRLWFEPDRVKVIGSLAT